MNVTISDCWAYNLLWAGNDFTGYTCRSEDIEHKMLECVGSSEKIWQSSMKRWDLVDLVIERPKIKWMKRSVQVRIKSQKYKLSKIESGKTNIQAILLSSVQIQTKFWLPTVPLFAVWFISLSIFCLLNSSLYNFRTFSVLLKDSQTMKTLFNDVWSLVVIMLFYSKKCSHSHSAL